MLLNTIAPDIGSKPKKTRVGRGVGSGIGKTCGKGHKGQKARAGGYHRVNFEGGQMPLQRRLPKFGFKSRVGRTIDEVKLDDLVKIEAEIITLDVLKNNGLIKQTAKRAKIFLSGEINKALKIKGLGVTKGAREQIVKLGGTIEE